MKKKKSEFCLWSEKTASSKKHLCQYYHRPSSTVLKSWSSLCKEAHVFHEKRVRKLHIKEICEIQTFPLDWFDIPQIALKDKIAMLGNAVPPRLAEAICQAIRNVFFQKHEPVQVLEICSGAGGLALGAHQAGFQCHTMIEMWKEACQVLQFHQSTLQFQNLMEINIEKIDFSIFANLQNQFFMGGPPCQPFSLIGQHKGNHDERDLFKIMPSLIEKVKPKVFLFENVPGLASIHKDYLNQIIHHFDQVGYHVHYQIFNALNFGVPQNRKRLFIIGVLKTENIPIQNVFNEIENLKPMYKQGKLNENPLSTVGEVITKVNLLDQDQEWKKIQFENTI